METAERRIYISGGDFYQDFISGTDNCAIPQIN
jgi:hypothetical protein